jgi:lipopolysaccharide transport system permease protein
VIVLLIFQLIVFAHIPWTVLLLPMVIFPLALICLGLSWFLSAIGVFLRDAGQTIGIFVTGLMFLSPVFFPLSAIPVDWQMVANLNPMVFRLRWHARSWSGENNLIGLIGFCTYVSICIAWSGFACFQKIRRGFADVI